LEGKEKAVLEKTAEWRFFHLLFVFEVCDRFGEGE